MTDMSTVEWSGLRDGAEEALLAPVYLRVLMHRPANSTAVSTHLKPHSSREQFKLKHGPFP